jgi:hypothetical protein
MEKRVLFRSAWLPWLLLAPQVIVISVFFFWPAAQALLQSFQVQDAFGTSTEWVGLQNFEQLFNDPGYLASFKTTALFSILVAVLGIGISLGLAVFADRIIKGALFYKTFLVVPYAVAPAVAGVLWVFMFSPSLGVVAYALGQIGINWNHLLDGGHAMTLIVMASVWKQISYNFLFPAVAALLDDSVPAAVADHVFPAGHQHGLRLFRHLRHRRCDHARRAGAGHVDPGLQGVLRRFQGHGPRRLGGAVGGVDGDRHRAHRAAIPLRRKESQLLNMWPPRFFTSCNSLPPGGAAAPAARQSRFRGPCLQRSLHG